MGGWGSLKLAMEHPELFSAVAVVCPPVDRLMKVRAGQYKNLPMKIFHGANDDIVSPMNAIEIYQEIKKVNKNIEQNHKTFIKDFDKKHSILIIFSMSLVFVSSFVLGFFVKHQLMMSQLKSSVPLSTFQSVLPFLKPFF